MTHERGQAASPRRQCSICLQFFRDMPEGQWRHNYRIHCLLSVRHRRAIAIRPESRYADDAAPLRYNLLAFAAARYRDANAVATAAEASSAFGVPLSTIAHQLRILEHRALIEFVDPAQLAIGLREGAFEMLKSPDPVI